MNYFTMPGIEYRRSLPPSLVFKESKIIIAAVERYFDITYQQMLQKSRIEKVRYPRQVLMYLLSKHTNINKSSIGRMFRMDHTSVIHSISTIQDFIDIDERVRNQVQGIVENF